MRKFFAISFGACLLAGCGQFTTSKQESTALAAAAAAQGDAYVNCVTQNALSYTGQNSSEIGTVMTVATAACQSALDSFTSAQETWLKTQVMLTDEPLAAAVESLNERAKADIAAQLVNRPAQASAAVAPAAAATAAAVAAPANSAPVNSQWTAQQRIYLDCMADQGNKYSGLNESATVVADVAQSRCRHYQGAADPALEQEGRARVMGAVLDAKLEQPAR